MSVVEIVVGLLPLLCDRIRGMTSKIVQLAKLFKDSLAIEFEPHRIPRHTALPVVVVCTLVFQSHLHDALFVHA